jgi:hypothetical protein
MKLRAYIGEPKKEPKKKKLAFPPDSQMKSQNPLYEKKNNFNSTISLNDFSQKKARRSINIIY